MANELVSISGMERWAKEVYPYGDQYWKGFTQAKPALDLLDSSQGIPFGGRSEGKYILIPVWAEGGANDAIPFAEQGGLATPSSDLVDRLQFNVASLSSSIKVTGLMMDTMKGGDQSVTDSLNFQMMARQKGFTKRLNRAIHNDGSGMLATCSASTTSTSLYVDDASKIPVGAHIICRNKTTGALSGSGQTANYALEVTARNTTTNVLTVEREDGTAVSLSGFTTADGVYWYDSQGKDVNGFGIICSSSNPSNWGSSTTYYGNINRSTAGNEWHQANELNGADSSSNAQTADIYTHIQPMIAQIEQAAEEQLGTKNTATEDGGSMAVRWFCFTGNDTFTALANQMSRDQRTMGPSGNLKGGYRYINYDGAVFVVDYDAPVTQIRFVHFPSVKRYQARDVGWDDINGSIWNRQNAADGRAADMHRANMIGRLQMISCQSRVHGRIYNLSATR